MNQYESELMAELLTASGYEAAADHRCADVCIVNSCTVTSTGDAKNRKYIHRIRRENPDCVLVRSGSYQTNQNGRVLLRDWDRWKEDESVHYYQGDEYIRRNLLSFNYIYNASMVVFRKDVFQQIDKSYQQLRYTGDWQCWIEFLTHGPICVYRRKLNYFRQHLNKVSARSNSTNKGIIDQVNVLAYALEHVKLSAFRRLMVRGEQYGTCVRWFRGVDNEEVYKACFDALENNLHAKKWHYRVYKFLTFFGIK